MKYVSLRFNNFICRLNKSILFFILFLIPGSLMAQADSTKTTEEVPLISPSLQFVTSQKSDNTIDLKVAMSAKVNNSPLKLELLKVTFLQVTDDAEKELGYLITDKSGKGILNVKADAIKTDNEGKINFKAVFAGNNAMEPVEEELTIKRARLEIVPVSDDSLKSVQVKLLDLGTGTPIPVPDATIGIFVKRLFKPLKIGEGSTDEAGEASIEIPANLPGDANGDITLIGRLDDNENYGNLEAGIVERWGIPVSNIMQKQPRALWSKNPPIWMLVTFIILMVTVWGHYIVIIFELFRLRKEQPNTQV